MDREILFRGQTRKQGEKVRMDGTPVDGNWVYGGIFQGSGDFSIIYGNTDPDNITAANLKKYIVYTDTVGQYTGLTDKNGVKIFEGDIVAAGYYKWKCQVVWDEECARFICYTFERERRIVYIDMTDKDGKSALEVIGTVHDNPELIGGEGDG